MEKTTNLSDGAESRPGRDDSGSFERPSFRLDMVPTTRIKRLPGIPNDTSADKMQRIKRFIAKRGNCRPVYLSEASGYMTLLAGTTNFEFSLKEKETMIPAVIVHTQDEQDELLFTLQSAELNDHSNMIIVSAALVRLIDSYEMPRQDIAAYLGKSPAWICRIEHIGRQLNRSVQDMVVSGQVSLRAAQEISRLPGNVQLPFAKSVTDNYLNKNSVAYLVSRYLNDDVSTEERARIIHSPAQALPCNMDKRSRTGKDHSEIARLYRAVAHCMDDAHYLLRVLDRIEVEDMSIPLHDLTALTDALCTLQHRITELFFAPGQKTDGNKA